MTATATYAIRITLAITAALIPAYVALPTNGVEEGVR